MNNKNPSPLKVLHFLLGFLRKKKLKYLVGATLNALEIIMTLLLPIIYQQITLYVSNTNSGNIMDTLLFCLIAIAVLTPFICIGSFTQKCSAADAESVLRKTIFSRLQRQRTTELQSEKIGNMLTLLSVDAERSMACLTNFSSVCLFRFIVLFAYSLVALLIFEWKIALFALAIGTMSFLFSISLSPKARAIGRRAQELAGDSSSFLLDSLRGLPVIRIFALNIERRNEYHKICQNIRRKRIWYRVHISFVDGLMSVIQYTTQPLILIVGSLFIKNLSLSIDQVVLCAGLASTMAEAFYNLSQFVSFIQNSLVSGQRIQAFISKTTEEDKITSPAVPNMSSPIAIELRNVGFCYQENRPVFEKLNAKIEKGSQTVIIGPSGGGKTTLLKLLEGLYQPTDGEIIYFGASNKELTISQIRKLFSYVPQECTLFEGTIAENIALGKPDATRTEVEKAAHLAELTSLISTSPLGLDTSIGERGLQLSGGQRQRIAIARAFIRNAPILLLDEATASLDSNSETAVLCALERLMKGKTVIQLSHRQSVIQQADTVFCLEKGKLTKVKS